MALTQPILNGVMPFDAANEQVFTFDSSGSSAPITSNTLTIRNNANNAVVYSQTQTTYAYKHIVPANTLSNGGDYVATIVTHDAGGNSSPASAAIQFYCFATPAFAISNMPSGNVIQNSSFNFVATYSQVNNELLNAYVFNLYSLSGALIATSSTQYTTADTMPIEVNYTFTGFEDNTQYQVEVIGQTIHGMEVKTPRLLFNVSYKESTVTSALILTNNCRGGYIAIQSNVIAIDGKSNPTPPTYIDNAAVDLRADGSWVKYDSGFNLVDNFTVKAWVKDMNPNTQIISFASTSGDIINAVYCTNENSAWLEMRVVPVGFEYGYTTQSNIIALPSSNEQIFIMLRRIDNIYELIIENRGVSA